MKDLLIPRLATAAVLVLGVALASGCGSKKAEGPGFALTEVKSWACQRQDLEAQGAVDALVASRYDLLVVDPTRTDSSQPATREFDTAAMVAKLKDSKARDGVHRKLVLACINIGEAEAWRWYWTWTKERASGAKRPADWPSFLLEPNAEDTGDDHPVAFWDPAWKAIVIQGGGTSGGNYASLLDEALRDGFDGVYLDWVEAYADERVANAAKKAGLDPAAEMVRFLGEIRAFARARNPRFLIVQANGSDLLVDHPDATQQVDAVAQEAIWYSGDTGAEWFEPTGYDQSVDASESDDLLANLKLYQKAGKPVFDLEYAVENAPIAYRLSKSKGLVPYCSRAALNQLSETPPEIAQ